MITALYGEVPYRYTRVAIEDVKGDQVLVGALSAWHDTGLDGPAERWVDKSELSEFDFSRISLPTKRVVMVGRIAPGVNAAISDFPTPPTFGDTVPNVDAIR